MDYLGQLDAAQLAGFGFGQAPIAAAVASSGNGAKKRVEITWEPEPIEKSIWREQRVEIQRVVLLLDGSTFAAQAIPMARKICQSTGAQLTMLSAVKDYTPALQSEYETTKAQREGYLRGVADSLSAEGIKVDTFVRPGHIADATARLVEEQKSDLVVTSTRGKSGLKHWLRGGVSRKLVQQLDIPILLVQGPIYPDGRPPLEKLLVTLDGSILSESVLPYARAFGKVFNSEVILLSVPAVPEMENYRAPATLLENLRREAEGKMRNFLEAVARSLRADGIKVQILVTGSIPEQTIVSVGEEQKVNMTMLSSHGRGGLDLLFSGSVSLQVVADSDRPVFMVPTLENGAVDTRPETPAAKEEAEGSP